MISEDRRKGKEEEANIGFKFLFWKMRERGSEEESERLFYFLQIKKNTNFRTKYKLHKLLKFKLEHISCRRIFMRRIERE